MEKSTAEVTESKVQESWKKPFKNPVIKSMQRVLLTSADSNNTVTREVVYSSMSLTVNTEVKIPEKKNIKGKEWEGEGAPPNLPGWAGLHIIFQQTNQTSSLDPKGEFSPKLANERAEVKGGYRDPGARWNPRHNFQSLVSWVVTAWDPWAGLAWIKPLADLQAFLKAFNITCKTLAFPWAASCCPLTWWKDLVPERVLK